MSPSRGGSPSCVRCEATTPFGWGQLSKRKTGSNWLAMPAVNATACGPGMSTMTARSLILPGFAASAAARALPWLNEVSIAFVWMGTMTSFSGLNGGASGSPAGFEVGIAVGD